MRHVCWLFVFLCLASCKSAEPPPPTNGVRIDAPFVRIRVADSPDPAIMNEEVPKKKLY